MRKMILIMLAAACGLAAGLVGCGKKDGGSESSGKETLVLISPHHESIKYEFEQAFKEHYKKQTGKDVQFQWRDIGGGSSSILRYLENVYANAETCGIDVLFGGGEFAFQSLDAENLLVPIPLTPDVLENIPAQFGGMELYSPNKAWVGNVLSSFGFLYNKQLLAQLKIDPPTKWEDLGKKEFFNLVMLGDPTQSGSIAAANEMIVQSAPTWQDGWAKLLMILSNAKKFTATSGDAANAPVLGEAVVSVCIDFYGSSRVSKSPDMLGYVSPVGQTGYTPDPIGILRNPPHLEVAQAFVNFILSVDAQALWALPVGHPAGPKRTLLNRPPIRKDFYQTYEKEVPEWISRPYAAGAEMKINAEVRSIRYGVLSQLVRAAAIDNLVRCKRRRRR